VKSLKKEAWSRLDLEHLHDQNILAAATIPAIDSRPDDARSEHKSEVPGEKAKSRKKSLSDFSLNKKLFIFIVSFGVFVVLWQVTSYLAGNTAILASPFEVLNALSAMLQSGSSSGATQGLQSVYDALVETLEVVALGLGLSVLMGIPIGVAMGRWRTVESILEPWVTATNSFPVVVLIPSLYFSIGGGLPADALISFVLSVFSVIINTHAGVKYMSNSLAEVGRTFRANERQFITKVVIPASLPDIFAGIRIAVGRALLGAVMAEALLGGYHGLGGLMTTYEEILNTPSMMATVLLISLVGILFLQAPKILERHLFRWKENERISRTINL